MIVFAHLLNDRSGSPRILNTVIEGLPEAEKAVLYIGSDGDGILGSARIPKQTYWYRRTGNRLLTLAALMLSQADLFWSLIRASDIPRDAIIYANTLLPFGAALYGRLSGRPVIFHIHEASISPPIFKAALVMIARHTASRLIYVSRTHREMLPIDDRRATTVFNTIDKNLAEKAARHVYAPRRAGVFTVLMLSYARDYKGIPEFFRLAASLIHRTDIAFHLVLSDLGPGTPLPLAGPNVSMLPPTDDTADYFTAASLVLNLSRPDLCVETFGLTLLEAMAFGIPVIAPPVGGPAEIVTDREDGLLIDSRDAAALTCAVELLADDEILCARLSGTARATAARYSHNAFADGIADVLQAVRPARPDHSG
ncbi:MAG: glycosyltransferase [Alphaproteobacteria bacterium]|nr:MAG: glycosyltransferase [Alphaproteobacteria bacterium]